VTAVQLFDDCTGGHDPVLVDTRAELMELAVASDLKVLHTMLEEDRTALCGPRYQHQMARQASRAGTVPIATSGALDVFRARPFRTLTFFKRDGLSLSQFVKPSATAGRLMKKVLLAIGGRDENQSPCLSTS
jgi:hypothetical protein